MHPTLLAALLVTAACDVAFGGSPPAADPTSHPSSRAATDALGAPACVDAVKALDEAERLARRDLSPASGQPAPPRRSATDAALQSPPPALSAARAAVRSACFGGRDASSPPPRPAAGAGPAAVEASPRPAPPAPAGAPPRALPIPPAPRTAPPPLTITACDANGCWASDGSRLTRLNGLLHGPRGPCTTVGAVLNCP